MTIVTRTHDGEGTTYIATFDDGTQAPVKMQPGLRKLINLDGTVLLPDDYLWLPLDRARKIEVQSAAGVTPSQLKTATQQVLLRCYGPELYKLAGEPLYKIAQGGVLHSLDSADVMFHLVGMGLSPGEAYTKVAASMDARELGVAVSISRELLPLDSQVLDKVASLAALPRASGPVPQVDLIKQAAYLPDPTSIDTILGLSLLTPDNIAIFTSKLPNIEETQRDVCELLLAARLGLRDIPIPALEQSITGLEQAIEALFQLRFQEADVT
jgi:hypothetical protein